MHSLGASWLPLSLKGAESGGGAFQDVDQSGELFS